MEVYPSRKGGGGYVEVLELQPAPNDGVREYDLVSWDVGRNCDPSAASSRLGNVLCAIIHKWISDRLL